MVRDFTTESLSHDPIHGYIPFISPAGLPAGEISSEECAKIEDAALQAALEKAKARPRASIAARPVEEM